MPGALRVLYVDDEPGLLVIGKLFLEQSGDFSVETIDSASKALGLLKNEEFDAIVSDYQMPEIDGIHFLKQLKGSGNTTPFIIFTGKGREEVVIQALNEGADFYLQKGGDPVSQFAELAHKIRIAVQQRRAEADLREKTRELDRFFNSSLDLLCIADTEGYFRRLNPEWERTLGYPLSELEGRRFLDLVHPDDLGPTLKAISTLSGQKEILDFSNRFLHKDGSYRWIEWRSYPYGEFIYAAARDITERRLGEEALQKSEERYRNVVEDQTEFISRFLPDGTHVFVNEAYCRYFGFSRNEILGHRFRPTLFPEDKKRVNHFLASLTPDKPVDVIEHRIIMPDGTIRWQRWSDRAIFDQSGTIIEYQSVGRDITEIKETEEELSNSVKKFRSLFDNAVLGIFLTTPEGRYIDINPAFARIAGYDSPQEMKSAISDIQQQLYIHPEDRQTINELLLTEGEIRNFETENRHRDGHSIWISINAKAVRDNNGKILAYEGTIEDITDRKLAEAVLAESEERFRGIFDMINDGIQINEFEPGKEPGKFLNLNEVACRMLQYTREELLERSPLDITTEYHNRPLNEILEELSTTGYSVFETEHRRKDGTLIPVEVHSHIGHLQGKTVAISVIRDITERKQAETALTESFATFKTVMDSLDSVVYVADKKTCEILFINEYTRTITGEVTGKICWKSMQVNQKGPCPFCTNEKLLGPGGIPTGTLIWEFQNTINGRWYECHDSAIRWTDGRIVRLEIATDITERKRVEEALQEKTEELDQYFSTSLDLFCIADTDGYFRRLNPEWGVALGYTPADLEGARFLDFVHPDDLQGTLSAMTDLDKKKSVLNFTNRYRHKDGSYRWIEWRSYPSPKNNLIFAAARDITERKRVEEALRESEERIHLLLDSTAEAIYGLDMDGGCTFCNAACLLMLGYSHPDELIGKNMHWQIHHKRPDGRPFPVEECRIFQAFIKGEGTHVDDEVLWRADGTWFPAEYWSFPQYRNGVIVGAVVTFIDITERKIAEYALKQSEERFRQMFEFHAAAMLLVNPENGAIIDANNAAARFYGYSRETFRTMKISDINRLPQQQVEGEYQKAARQARNDFIFPHQLANGEIRTVEVHSTPITINQQTVLFSIIHDITERKRVEEELLQTTDRLWLATTAGGVGIWDYDVVNNRLTWDDQMFALYGITEEQFGGAYEAWQAGLHPEDKQRGDEAIQMALRGEKEFDIEFRVLWPDGSVHTIRGRALVQRDVSGKPLRMIGTNWDITELKRAEDAVLEANKKLNILNSITRHDVLNQITALVMLLEVVEEEVKDPETLDFIHRAEGATERITRQIEFTREYQDIGVQAPQWQNVSAMVTSARDQLAECPYDIRIDLGSLEIYADPLLPKVFYNLLENAVRHGEHVSVVRFSSQESENGLLLIYEDNGAGVDAGSKKNLFKRGFGKHTGFGLYLMQEILSITSITIVETGEPGKGARFEMMIPKGMYRQSSEVMK